MHHLGTQTRITPKSLLKDYSRLGSFLHAKKPAGSPHTKETLSRSVATVIKSLERYRGDSILANFAGRHKFACSACGREIIRRVRALDLDPLVRCPNKDCRAIHERIPGEAKGEYRFRMVQQNFACPFCKVTGYFDVHKLQPGVKIKCRGCGKEFLIRLIADPVETNEQSAPPSKEGPDASG
jgi:ribosomal protein L37AE/L43A